jgi:hypothetical protein
VPPNKAMHLTALHAAGDRQGQTENEDIGFLFIRADCGVLVYLAATRCFVKLSQIAAARHTPSF